MNKNRYDTYANNEYDERKSKKWKKLSSKVSPDEFQMLLEEAEYNSLPYDMMDSFQGELDNIINYEDAVNQRKKDRRSHRDAA